MATEAEMLEVIEARDAARRRRESSTVETPAQPGRVYSQTTSVPTQSARPTSAAGDDIPVRRPGYGIIPSRPNVATLEVVVMDNNTPLELYNSSYNGGRGPATTNFICQGMRWAPQEASRIVRTYGDFYMADVGENPDVLLVSGVLIESHNFPWFTEWRYNWEEFLRARRCILNKAEVHFTLDNVTWRGYMLNCEIQRTQSFQSSWSLMPISFQMVLREVESLEHDGVQVGPNAIIEPTVTPIVELYQRELAAGGDLSFAASLWSAYSAFGLELVGGTNDDATRWVEPEVAYPETDEDVVHVLNINKLTSLARALNEAAGVQVYDLGETRRGLISIQNSAMAARGSNSPYGTPTNQNAYAAKAQRQAERAQSAIARRGVRGAASIFTF